jgi:hypothetical protein
MTDAFDIRNSAFSISPIRHLPPQAMAAFVLANGSMSLGESIGEDAALIMLEASLTRPLPVGEEFCQGGLGYSVEQAAGILTPALSRGERGSSGEMVVGQGVYARRTLGRR